MAANEQMQNCACPDCKCEVSPATAVERNGKKYCSQTCADGHADGSIGCGHTGCACGKAA